MRDGRACSQCPPSTQGKKPGFFAEPIHHPEASLAGRMSWLTWDNQSLTNIPRKTEMEVRVPVFGHGPIHFKQEDEEINSRILQNYLFSPLELAEHPLKAFMHVIELEKKKRQQCSLTSQDQAQEHAFELQLYHPTFPTHPGQEKPCCEPQTDLAIYCSLAPSSGDYDVQDANFTIPTGQYVKLVLLILRLSTKE